MTTVSSTLGDREIELSRTFDAPRELVWKAFTEADELAQWWGPAGFSLTTKSREFKPGGTWRYVMHGPDGRDYLNITTFNEIVPNERLKYKQGGVVEGEPVNFEVTVTFEEVGDNKTKLTMRSLFPSKNAREYVIREYNALEGGKQHLGRLGEHLQSMIASPATKPFVITRVFDAPIDLVWKVWTDREHLMQWFGPANVNISRATLDLRIGGTFHYCQRDGDGNEAWAKWTFRKIAPPDRLEFLISAADETGKTIPIPFDPNWPTEMLSVVTFVPHAGIGKGTVVRVEWTPHNANAIAQKTFDAGRGMMQVGWTGTLDRLAKCFASKAFS
ncbi:MAG: SRPBCC family protein [Phycisphaerales bacterium]